eukprot:3379357-Pleurochrysis_carterae.AAC.1
MVVGEAAVLRCNATSYRSPCASGAHPPPTPADVLTHAYVRVWSEVYKKEFIPQMQSIGHYVSNDSGGEGSYATWRDARK